MVNYVATKTINLKIILGEKSKRVRVYQDIGACGITPFYPAQGKSFETEASAIGFLKKKGWTIQ